jgi:hypothetical protein
MFEDLPLAVNAGAGTTGPVDWPGGIGTFKAVATWGGGNVKLQALGPDSDTWYDLVDVVLSANGAIGFEHSRGSLRAVITTATGVHAAIGPVSS